MEILAGSSRGSFLVCIGWTTLIVTGEVARVGQVFVVAMLTNILAGPILGTIVDRYNRKTLVLIAHCGIGAVMISSGATVTYSGSSSVFLFLVPTVGVYILRQLYQLAHDGLLRANVSDDELVHTIARCRTIHLIGTAAGTLTAGVILDQYGTLAGFVFSAAMSIGLLLPVLLVRGVTAFGGSEGLAGFFRDLATGFQVLAGIPSVRLMAFLSAAVLPVGQLSNAVLSSYIHDDLGKGGDVFGLVDSAWPVGGMLAAAIMSLGLPQLSGRYSVFAFSVLAGLATVVFAFCTTVPALVLVHCAMGAFVWFGHILIDAEVLRACGTQRVCRAKVFVYVMFSLSAAIMCLSPSFVPAQSSSSYFLFWGGSAIIISLVIAVFALRRSAH